MYKKSIFMRIVACLCAIMMCVGMLHISPIVETVAAEETGTEEVPVWDDSFTVLDFGSFGIAEKTYGKGMTAKESNISGLDRVIFEGTVNFSMTQGARFIIGGMSEWHGLALYSDPTCKVGELRLYIPGQDAKGMVISSADAGVALQGEDLNFAISCEYVDEDGDDISDIKVALWFNGQCYLNQYFYFEDGAKNFGGYASIYVEGDASLAVRPTAPIINPSFTKVDFASYGIQEQSLSATEKAITKYGTPATAVSNLDKVLFQDTVNFLSGPSRFTVGGKDGFFGVSLYANPQGNPGELELLGGGFNIKPAIVFTSEQAGVNLRDGNLDVTMSFEYVDHDNGGEANDVRFAIWFNGKCYNNQYYYLSNCTQHFGNRTTVYVEAGGQITISPANPKPLKVDESFTKINFATYGFTAPSYGSPDRNLSPEKTSNVVGLDKTVFQDTVNFKSEFPYFVIGGNAANGFIGVRLYSEGENLKLVANGVKGSPTYTFTPQEAEATLVGANLGLTMSFEYVDYNNNGGENDVQIAIWFNGKCYKNQYYYLPDCTEQLGPKGLVYVPKGGTFEIPTEKITSEPIVDESFTKIDSASFGFQRRSYLYHKNPYHEQTGFINNLDKVIFQEQLRFSQASGTRLLLGGKSEWNGVALFANPDGNPGEIELIGGGWNISPRIVFTSENAGVDLRDRNLDVTMSFEYVNYDNDGGMNDVRFAIWFDGICYNNQYYYLKNCTQFLGNYMSIYTQTEGAALTITQETETDILTFYDSVDEAYESGSVQETKTYNLGSSESLEHTTFVGKFMFSSVTEGENELKIGTNEGGLIVNLQSHDILNVAFRTGENEEVQLGTIQATEIGATTYQDNWLKLEAEFEVVNVSDTAANVMIRLHINDDCEKIYEIKGVNKDLLGRMVTLVGTESQPLYHDSAVAIDVYNLGSTEKGYLISGQGTITVNHKTVANGDILNQAGDYIIRCKEHGAYVKYIVLYNSGDAHVDDAYDVRDLVAMKKLVADNTTSDLASKYAADMNGDGNIQDNDMDLMRQYLCTGFQTAESFQCPPSEDGVMPIAGFYGPYNMVDTRGKSYNFVNDSIYQKIKDVGVNLISYIPADYRDVTQRNVVLDNLELADKNGIDFYVIDSSMQKELTDVQLAVRLSEYAKYNSFKGIFVVDEPFTEGYTSHDSEGKTTWEKGQRRLEDYASQLKFVNSFSNLSGYMNLNPMNASLNKTGQSLEQAYSDYVDRCLATGVKVLSWDYYVWDQYISAGTTTQRYFENLTIMSNKAREAKIPFWCFVQAGSNWNDSKTDMSQTDNTHPTEAELLWNVNTSLAYGAKGIQYFTLIQPPQFAYSENQTYDYQRNGLIGANGETTVWYDYAAKANKQIALVDEYLMRANLLDVLATQSGNAQSDTGINHDNYDGICINGKNGAVAGVFEHFGKKAIYLVNYDTQNEGTDQITIHFTSSQKYEVIGSDEQVISGMESGEGDSCTVTLVNGGAAFVLLD